MAMVRLPISQRFYHKIQRQRREGFAYADYDNDGDIDLFPVTSLVTSSDPIRMIRY